MDLCLWAVPSCVSSRFQDHVGYTMCVGGTAAAACVVVTERCRLLPPPLLVLPHGRVLPPSLPIIVCLRVSLWVCLYLWLRSAKFNMSMCVLGMAEELRSAGTAVVVVFLSQPLCAHWGSVPFPCRQVAPLSGCVIPAVFGLGCRSRCLVPPLPLSLQPGPRGSLTVVRVCRYCLLCVRIFPTVAAVRIAPLCLPHVLAGIAVNALWPRTAIATAAVR